MEPDDDTSAGLLVTFEGGEGSGKSTQMERLAEWLSGRSVAVSSAREPGSTATGEAVRRFLLEHAPEDLAPEAEFALFLAARAQLVREIVRPALAAGRVVLLDRYGDSSVAYQGYGRGLDPGRVAACNDWATGGLVPDLTVLIDVEPGAAAARRGSRPPDRMERNFRSFHERVRMGYHRMALNEPERYFVLEGSQSIEAIQEAIRERVGDLLANRRRQGRSQA